MDYLPTLGEKWLHSRGNVGKYSLHGTSGNVWVSEFGGETKHLPREPRCLCVPWWLVWTDLPLGGLHELDRNGSRKELAKIDLGQQMEEPPSNFIETIDFLKGFPINFKLILNIEIFFSIVNICFPYLFVSLLKKNGYVVNNHGDGKSPK